MSAFNIKSKDVASILKRRVNAIARESAQRMGEWAEKSAQQRYDGAVYAGTNDVTVDHEVKGTKVTVTARGSAVGFIEYGTGIGYPTPAESPYPHGTFGQGKGANPPWTYYGETGNAPRTYVVRSGKKGDVVRTYGNPANLCLHLTKQELQENAARILREVNHE